MDHPRETTAGADPVNILIVDDLPDKLLVLRTILEGPDINVLGARSGQEALRMVLDHELAVILLDVNMPGMDGLETAQLIRRRPKSAHTPIIFVTAFADDMHTAQGYSLGAVDYILSPVVPQVLRTKVEVFVDLFRMTQQVRRQADERVALAREQAARVAAEENTRRMKFLADASKVLAGLLQGDAILSALLRQSVPFLADLGAFVLPNEHGKPLEAKVAWIDKAEVWHEETHTCSAAESALLSACKLAMAKGDTEFVTANPEQPLSAWEALGVESRTTLSGAELGLTAAAVLPLVARGSPLGWLVLAMGPSGRSYDAADLMLAKDLAHRAGIALDNARLYQDIQDEDRRKNEFLAMLSHELRNPLAPIRNAVELLRRRGSDPVVVSKTQALIGRQVEHLVRLVDDLLDISRITRGKIELQLATVSLADVVKRAIETSRVLLDSRRHTLEQCLPDEPLTVRGDAVRLAQVVSNLLCNAAKYTQEGGYVWLTVERQGPFGLIRVRDTGVGIPRDMLASVFDLFTQVNRSLDRSQGGLGIGLTLVRRLVELHGGRVEAVSAGDGQGSEFVVTLPLSAPIEETVERLHPATATNGEHAASTPRRRILVAEDDPVSALSLEWVLQEDGHVVRVCHDGPAVLAAVDAFDPEIVLLDIGLPGMDGYRVASQLRQRLGQEKPLLVALTGYGQAQDRCRSQAAGFDHHLVKPVDYRVLKELFVGRREKK